MYNSEMKEPFLKKKIIFIVLLMLLSQLLRSQTFVIRNYSKKDGLPGTVIMYLFQDSGGYLWAGTNKGLCKFDGRKFIAIKTNDHIEPNINAIQGSGDGKLWIGTQKKGVFCLQAGRPVPVSGIKGIPKELSRGKISSIIRESNGNLWFGTESGLVRYDGTIFKTFTTAHGLLSNIIVDLAIGKNGKIWIVSQQGVGFLRNEQFQILSLPKDYTDYKNYKLLQHSGGMVWIGTTNGLIGCENGRFVTYREQDGFINSNITSLMEDSEGNTWLGTWNGITRLSGDAVTNVTAKNGLANNFTYHLLEDREGNIWVATHNGLSCIKSINIASYSKKDGLPDGTVYDMILDGRKRFWIGTYNGLGRLENGNLTIFGTQDGLTHNSIYELLEDKRGKIWIGTFDGLVTYSGGIFTPVRGLRGMIFDLAEGKDGVIWIGTVKGLYRWHNGTLSPMFSTSSTFQGDTTKAVYCVFEDSRNNLWYSTAEGLFKYSVKGSQQISGNRVRVIYEDSRGAIWVGSVEGLNRYYQGIHHYYSTSEGLPDNACNVILEDKEGLFWIGTENGLASFDGKKFRTYNSLRHGFPSDAWKTGFKDREGRIWLGGSDGVTSFKPPPVRFNRVPPPVYITGLKVLEAEIPLDRLGLLGPKENYIRFTVNGLCTSSPESVVYRYKLEGTNSGWQESKNPVATYPYLPSGEYRFLVKAVNNDGIESVKPAEVSFRILPPFWRTWWFLSLSVLSAMFFTAMLVRWRYIRSKEKSQLEAKNKMLVMAQRMELMGTLAAGTVHDLKNLLSIILGYTRVISRKFRPGDDEHQHLETIKDTAGTAVQMSSQILSLARFSDELPGEVELGECLEEILKTLKITLPESIEIVEHLPEEPIRFVIHPARFQQVVLNLCQNAAHAMLGGGKLTVSLIKTDQNGVQMEIGDTGTGIPPELIEKIFEPLFTTKKKGKGTGLGLFVVKQIVEQHGGSIDVRSEPGMGTIFTILLKKK